MKTQQRNRMSMRVGGVFALAIAGAVIVSGLSPRQNPLDPIVHKSFPKPADLQLQGSEKSSVALATNLADVRGRMTYDTIRKQVSIDWIYKVAGLTTGVLLSDPSLARSSQTIALDFWPTEAIAVGPLEILVAGVSPYGNHVLQAITLEPLTVLPSAAIDAVTGEVIVPDLALNIEGKQILRRSNAIEGRYVGHMWANRGDANSVFVQYQDTREIVRIDLSTGQEVEQVAVTPSHANPDPAALVVPGLTKFYLAANDGEHLSMGHLYWLHSPNVPSGKFLVFDDADKDGSIDSAVLLDDWTAAYATYSSYASLR